MRVAESFPMCLAHASTTMERHISKIGNSIETRFYDGKNIEDPKEGMIKREVGGGLVVIYVG